MRILGELDEVEFKKQFVVIYLAAVCASDRDTNHASAIAHAELTANQVWKAIKRV